MKSKGAALVTALALVALAAVTVGHAAGEGKGTRDKKEVVNQELCPATPGAGVCQVNSGCCSVQTPDSPPAKAPVKAKKEPKKSD